MGNCFFGQDKSIWKCRSSSTKYLKISKLTSEVRPPVGLKGNNQPKRGFVYLYPNKKGICIPEPQLKEDLPTCYPTKVDLYTRNPLKKGIYLHTTQLKCDLYTTTKLKGDFYTSNPTKENCSMCGFAISPFSATNRDFLTFPATNRIDHVCRNKSRIFLWIWGPNSQIIL